MKDKLVSSFHIKISGHNSLMLVSQVADPRGPEVEGRGGRVGGGSRGAEVEWGGM